VDWREYEAEIFGRLREQFPGTELELDARLLGRISGLERQIDIRRAKKEQVLQLAVLAASRRCSPKGQT